MLSHFSRVRLCVTMWRLPRPWDSPGKNTGVGGHFLLQYMKVESESEVSAIKKNLDFATCSGMDGLAGH